MAEQNLNTTVGIANFKRQLKKFVKDLPREHLKPLQQKLALEILTRLVMKTPVDTGRARGNWQVGINESPSGVIDIGKLKRKAKRDTVPGLSTAGQGAISKGTSKITGSGVDGFGTIFITNNLPYIEVLDAGRVGNKGSIQAPAGMLGPTMNELTLMFGI